MKELVIDSLTNKTMRNVIFIIPSPCFQRDYHRFGCEYLAKCGYNVKIWFVPIDGDSTFSTQAGMYKGSNLFKFSLSEYSREILSNDDAWYIVLHFSAEILLPLAKNKCLYILYGGFGRTIPSSSLPIEMKRHEGIDYTKSTIANDLFKLGLTGVLKRRIQKKKKRDVEKEYRKLLITNPPCMIVTSVAECLNEYYRSDEIKNCREIVDIHSYDYDRFIETNREDSTVNEDYIVYLDSGIFFPSYDSERLSAFSRAQEHCDEIVNKLEVLFTSLSNYYKMPLIIAGHPHIKYPANAYNGREIVFNDSCKLVKNSKFVITSDSTAVSFVALYNKPLLRFSSKWFHEMDPSMGVFFDELIEYKSRIEGTGFLNLDDEKMMSAPWKCITMFDPEKRKDYIKEYIIDNDTTEETTYEVLEKKLRLIQ